MSLPAWGVWIEMPWKPAFQGWKESLPAWGVWIEIICYNDLIAPVIVTPRMGSVD